MYTNEILEEKDRVQKKLSEEAKDIHDYFMRAEEAVKQIEVKYGIQFKRGSPPFTKPILNMEL